MACDAGSAMKKGIDMSEVAAAAAAATSGRKLMLKVDSTLR